MIDEIYYDTFKNSYTLERVENSTPERFKRIRRGVNDLYRECWVINSDIYDEDDVIGYMYNNMYPEDVISIDWR